MRLPARNLHVLAVGLWFGAAVFFSFVIVPSLFNSFESLAEKPQRERPSWFPVVRSELLRFGSFDPNTNLNKEQGTLAAGHAVGRLFDYYFLLQGLCGLVAVVTALRWWRADDGRRVDKARFVVVLLALATAAACWLIERNVRRLEAVRNRAIEAELRSEAGIVGGILRPRHPGDNQSDLRPERASAAEVANAERAHFGFWHSFSRMLNFVTVILVAVAMALTAFLPRRTPAPGAS